MQARCATTLPRKIRLRPTNRRTALDPLRLAIRAGKYAYWAGIKRRASWCGGLRSAGQVQTSPEKTTAESRGLQVAGNQGPQRHTSAHAEPRRHMSEDSGA